MYAAFLRVNILLPFDTDIFFFVKKLQPHVFEFANMWQGDPCTVRRCLEERGCQELFRRGFIAQ